jgi:hypothetical protein
MAEQFSISWSEESLKQIRELVGWAGMLSPVIQQALKQGGEAIVKQAQDNTWQRFKEPTGTLASSIHVLEESPFELQISADQPYAARLNYGFHGRDSLNRLYDQPGTFWLSDALASQSEEVLALLQQGIETLMSEGGA